MLIFEDFDKKKKTMPNIIGKQFFQIFIYKFIDIRLKNK